MLTETLMVVLTHPQDPTREAEFNDWYTGNHVPDVLHAPNFKEAVRYKLAVTTIGDVPPYLALYHVDSEDVKVADEELMKYLGAPDARRMPIPPPTGEAEGIDVEGGRVAPGLVTVDAWAFFRKTLEVGHVGTSPNDAAKALLVTMTGPAKDAAVDELNAWYNAHVDDIVSTPGITGGARYERVVVKAGEIAPYFAIYECDTADVDKVAQELATVMATCPSGGIPTTPSGQPALEIAGYAYYTLVSAPTREHTLLPE
jgi:hypothetical protein